MIAQKKKRPPTRGAQKGKLPPKPPRLKLRVRHFAKGDGGRIVNFVLRRIHCQWIARESRRQRISRSQLLRLLLDERMTQGKDLPS